ncbi:hypothetical protein B0H66DRAFT_611626 [Apodospora peruviana]|uniref:F-box domain-containing protein n=1 Tax=Apodospora peruviana TaxID=516989 RepID=A0AAE0MF44_9PEZI|nr:hypothetical protein B0H66DRAFT_611626 [Apodospora peruviana]
MVSDGQVESETVDGCSPSAQLSDEVGFDNQKLGSTVPNDTTDKNHDAIHYVPMETDENNGSLKATDTGADNGNQMTVVTTQSSPKTDELRTSSRKRKSPGHNTDHGEATWPEGPKKVKLYSNADHAEHHVKSRVTDSSLGRDKSLLPTEIWHHIFTFCPPKSLGNLLCVNKLFNHSLDPSSSVRPEFPVSVTKGALRSLEPNAIWQASRRLFWPLMPTPLRSKTELDMWRLACSQRCQKCQNHDARFQATSSDPWQPGPGPDGVAAVWPFASRLCLPCLLKTSLKEVDLLVSPSIPNAILPALPFVLLNQDFVIVTASALESGQLPTDMQITRLYSSSDVEVLEQEFLAVKDMGSGTVEEWLKGLKGRGNDVRHEASKWEKWEGSGGLAKMVTQLYPGYDSLRSPNPAADVSIDCSSARISSQLPISATSTQSGFLNRPERTIEEVAELKAARKAEIERRALLLNPPLTANVLRHIPSFLAATQIITPMDESAWELLKPRLLAQQAEAEERERESEASNGMPPEHEEHQLETTLATTKEARDLVDKEWEEIQAPVRVKLACYADEIVRDKWEKGKRLSKDTCSKFATDVLIYVRKRFYDEIAREHAAARAAGQSPAEDPPEGPFTQKLTLENMKWVFDTKIKPHTESHRKELFYCNGCDGNFKAFGFEGVIQHYAAKHTTALSVGSVVVHWRAEWPEHPPFASESRPVKQPYYGQASVGHFSQHPSLPPSNYHYQPLPAPPVTPSYPPPPGPGYGAPPYVDPYQQPPPPQPYATQGTYPPFVPPTPFGQPQPYVSSSNPYSPYQPPAGPYPPPPVGVDPASGYAPPQNGNHLYTYGSHQANGPAPYPVPAPPAYPDTYLTKLEDIARNSREIWNTLGSVKDLPGSARVFATIHHLVKRYRARFYETPCLAMFIDGLSNNKDMRPVRNINGLVCKLCHFGLGNAASVHEERKSFSLPQLANHFQSKHVEPMQRTNSPADWILDMVLLPDVNVLSSVCASAGETQRSLIADALPESFRPQPIAVNQPPYDRQLNHTEPHPSHSVDPQHRPYEAVPRTDIHMNGEGDSNAYHVNRPPVAEYGPSNYSGSGQVNKPLGARNDVQGLTSQTVNSYLTDRAPLTAAEGVYTDHDRVTHSSGNRRSPQSSRPNRHQNGTQNNGKKAGKNKRGKGQDNNKGNRRLLEEEVKKDEKEARREEEKIRAMWAADRADTARAYSSSTRPDHGEATGQPSASQAPQELITRMPQNHQKPPSQKAAAPPVPEKEELNLLAALEMHLDQGRSPASVSNQHSPSDVVYLDGRCSALPVEPTSVSRTYARYSDDVNRPGSAAPYGGRYYHADVPARERSPQMRRLESGYYSRPAPAERQEAGYNRYRLRSEYSEQLPRYADSTRYDLPPPRPDDRGHEPAPRPDYTRYPEEGHAPSRQPVELFEIVHVTDATGEYYIKRPLRREPEPPRYAYEEDRRLYRDTDPYAAYEPVRMPSAMDSRPSESRRRDVRVDPAYQEEYDPRFPAV